MHQKEGWLITASSSHARPRPLAVHPVHTKFLHRHDNLLSPRAYRFIQLGLAQKPLSLRPNGKGTADAVPLVFLRDTPQPIATVAVSSTFASRRNLAASSGGVGLM